MTTTRRALWVSQTLHPDVSHVVAFGLTLEGPLRVQRLIDTTRDVLAHVGWLDVHIPPGYSPVEAVPGRAGALEPLRAAASSVKVIEQVDLSRCDDPDTESERRAQQFIDAADGADLARPLFRSELHLLGDNLHRWVIRAHHVLTDGAGLLRVMGHVADVYGGGAVPGDLAVAYTDELASDETRYADSRRRGVDAEYWDRVLDGYQPSSLSGTATSMTSEIIRVTRRSAGCRPAGANELVAALAGLCARLLDSPDVGIALPVAARTSAVRRRAVQPLSNVVPLDLRGIGDLTAPDAVEAVSSAIIGALRHQLYPREDMLRDRDDVTAFGVVVNLLPAFSPPVVDGLHWSLEVMRTGPVVDVVVTIHPADETGGRAITWEAPAASFDEATLSALALRFDSYLTALLREIDHGVPIPDDAVFLEGEWDRFRYRSGPPAPSYTPTAALFSEYCDADPSAPAVIFDGEVWSRSQLAERVYRGARVLTAAGVVGGDPVVVHAERSPESVVAFWSVLMAGGVWVPLGGGAIPEERVRSLVARVGARVGLRADGSGVDAAVRWLSPAPDVGDPGFVASEAAEHDCLRGLDRGPDDAAYVLFTSGSTGEPKGVVMPHRGIPALVADIRTSYGLSPRSRLLHAASPTFDTAIVEMLAAVATGAALVVAPGSVRGGDELGDVVRREHVSHMIVTPSVLETVPLEVADGLSQVIVGGETLPRHLVERWADRVSIRNAYGPTETRCSINISRPLPSRGTITVGPPMVGVVEAVLDRRGRPQPPGALGVLHCAGVALADGYLDDPGSTAQSFVACTMSDDARMYRTGDVAAWTSDGELRILGRRDGQVKLRGVRIELGEVDVALSGCAGVRNCVTTLRELPSGKPGLVSFVVADDPANPPEPHVLRHALAQRLPSYTVPAIIIMIDEIPRTATGKLGLAALRDHPLPVFESTRAASGPVEELLMRVIGDVLGIESPDPVLGFVDQGGDSLGVVEVARRLTAQGHPEIGPNDVLTAPDLASLVERMTESSSVPTDVATPSSTRDGVGDRRLTAAERTVVRLPGDPLAQLICVAWVPDPDARPLATQVAALVAALLDRHPALRATFPDTPSGPVCRTLPEVALASVVTRISVTEQPDREWLRSEARQMAEVLDVRNSPPLAVRLLVGPGDSLFGAVAVLHHIAIDGQSLAVLARDAEMLLNGEQLPAGPRPRRDPDVANGPDALERRRFWKQLLTQYDSIFEFDGIDPGECRIDVALRRREVVDSATYRRFRARASAEHMTPFEAFGHVVAIALRGSSGKEGVMAATAVSTRPPGSEGVVANHVLAVVTPLVDHNPEDSVTLRRRCIREASQPLEEVLDLAGRAADGDHLFPVPVLLGWSPVVEPPSSGGALHAFPPRLTRWLLQIEGCPRPDGALVIRVVGAEQALGRERTERVLAEVVGSLRQW